MRAKAPRTRRRAVAVTIVGLSCVAAQTVAHPTLDEHAEFVESALRRDPTRAALYLKRGDLHRRRGEWENALADYAHAQNLDAGLSVAARLRAEVLLEANKTQEAIGVLNAFLAAQPEDPKALVIRARALSAAGNPTQAARDLDRAVGLMVSPRPDHYRELAGLLLAAGEEEEALAALDRGRRRLGPVAALQHEAINIELRRRRYDAALARAEEGEKHSSVPVLWAARRAEILEMAGRTAEARHVYRQALDELNPVAGNRPNSKPAAELQRRLRAGIERLQENVPGKVP